MRDVERTRRVGGTPAEVLRLLSPTTVVDWEGSFDVFDVDADGDDTVVTAGGTGVKLRLRFVELDDGYRYEQVGDSGPFEEMTTRLRVAAEDEGARVTAASSVAFGSPVPLADRVAAWKRGGELDRLLDRIDAET